MGRECEFSSDNLGSFPGRGGCELIFQFFKDSNKELWVRNRRKRFYGEMWGNAVRGGGT